MDLSEMAGILIRNQICEWDLAARNYTGLKNVRVRDLDFGNYKIIIQYNPERMVSSAAKVDPASIEARPCFLCQKNLPVQQRFLPIDDDFLLLVNPFPIFPEHLTIPAAIHSEQLILGNFERMLEIASQLNEFVIFYNGPKCGASAPDHLHFQAGIKGFLPIENDTFNVSCCVDIRKVGNVAIAHWPDYARGIITLTSDDRKGLSNCFAGIYEQLKAIQPQAHEPMLNILATFNDGVWRIHIIPRTLHRPEQYFETGARRIILSPASVDMGGVFITPRKEDFLKITAGDVTDIFRQVCFEPSVILRLILQL